MISNWNVAAPIKADFFVDRLSDFRFLDRDLVTSENGNFGAFRPFETRNFTCRLRLYKAII